MNLLDYKLLYPFLPEIKIAFSPSTPNIRRKKKTQLAPKVLHHIRSKIYRQRTILLIPRAISPRDLVGVFISIQAIRYDDVRRFAKAVAQDGVVFEIAHAECGAQWFAVASVFQYAVTGVEFVGGVV